MTTRIEKLYRKSNGMLDTTVDKDNWERGWMIAAAYVGIPILMFLVGLVLSVIACSIPLMWHSSYMWNSDWIWAVWASLPVQAWMLYVRGYFRNDYRRVGPQGVKALTMYDNLDERYKEMLPYHTRNTIIEASENKIALFNDYYGPKEHDEDCDKRMHTYCTCPSKQYIGNVVEKIHNLQIEDAQTPPAILDDIKERCREVSSEGMQSINIRNEVMRELT